MDIFHPYNTPIIMPLDNNIVRTTCYVSADLLCNHAYLKTAAVRLYGSAVHGKEIMFLHSATSHCICYFFTLPTFILQRVCQVFVRLTAPLPYTPTPQAMVIRTPLLAWNWSRRVISPPVVYCSLVPSAPELPCCEHISYSKLIM